jgi:hypothetical protein
MDINKFFRSIPRWIQAEMNGYEPKTTYWQDFYIAAMFGGKAIRSTYRKAKREWGTDEVYFTEISMVLNHLLWFFWQHKRHDVAIVFDELWRDSTDHVYTSWTEEQRRYFWEITD